MSIDFIIFAASIAVVVVIAGGITLWGKRDARLRRESLGRLCTAETTGTVTEVVTQGPDVPVALKVSYEVDGTAYRLRERLTAKADGGLGGRGAALGFTKRPAMRTSKVGDAVRVRYNPSDPRLAHLPENDGVPQS